MKRPWRSGVACAGAVLIAAGAFALGSWWRPFPAVPVVLSHAELRSALINGYLRQVRAPYVFLAGDSFLELYQPEPLPCGREVVNGGIGGFKIADTLKLVRGLSFANRPAVVLLSVGFNDLFRKPDAADAQHLEQFRRDAESLIALLGAGGAKVLVAEIPPVDESMAPAFATAGFEAYSDAYRELCGRLGCTMVDPYAAYRSDAFWKAKPGASPDRIHIGDLRGAFRSLQADLCR